MIPELKIESKKGTSCPRLGKAGIKRTYDQSADILRRLERKGNTKDFSSKYHLQHGRRSNKQMLHHRFENIDPDVTRLEIPKRSRMKLLDYRLNQVSRSPQTNDEDCFQYSYKNAVRALRNSKEVRTRTLEEKAAFDKSLSRLAKEVKRAQAGGLKYYQYDAKGKNRTEQYVQVPKCDVDEFIEEGHADDPYASDESSEEKTSEKE